MQINSEAERRCFQKVLRYLQDEKIKIEEMEYAIPANEFGDVFEPDDLLTLEHWHLHRDQEAHAKELIAATGIAAFDQFTA